MILTVGHAVDCKTIVFFFLKISKEIGKAWRKSLTRAKRASSDTYVQLMYTNASSHLM